MSPSSNVYSGRCGPNLRGGVTEALGLLISVAEIGLGVPGRSVFICEGAVVCGLGICASGVGSDVVGEVGILSSVEGICTSGVGDVVEGGVEVLSVGICTSTVGAAVSLATGICTSANGACVVVSMGVCVGGMGGVGMVVEACSGIVVSGVGDRVSVRRVVLRCNILIPFLLVICTFDMMFSCCWITSCISASISASVRSWITIWYSR